MTYLSAFGGAAVATWAVFAGVGCGKSEGPPLAVINGEVVTMDDFHKYLEAKSRVRVMTANGPALADVAESLAFQALQDMVARQVTLQMSRDEGVYPSDAEVIKELEFRKKLQPNFLQGLTKAGLTVDRIKQGITLELAREKLLTKGVTVTAKDAEDYMRANPKEFVESPKVDLLWVFVRDEAGKADVNSALKAGQTFSIVAVQKSIFPGAKEANGRFPQRDINTFQPQLQKVVNATPEGGMTDWLQLSDGWARFYVEKKVPSKPIEMTAERKELLRRQLAQRRGSQAMDLGKRVLDKLLKSKIEVKERSLMEAWDRAFERFKEEQKVEVPTATGTPGG